MAAETPEAQETSKQVLPHQLDWLQMGFWACLLLAVGAASATLAWPNAGGPTGLILLISMAAGGMVFLLWILRGAGRGITRRSGS